MRSSIEDQAEDAGGVISCSADCRVLKLAQLGGHGMSDCCRIPEMILNDDEINVTLLHQG